MIRHEWEMEHVPHSIYIQPLHTYHVWPFNPNRPITPPYIQEINTFDDWRIVPTSRPVIAPPVFRENYIDIPGTYGSLDYSRAHTGLPVYGNRSGSWEFVVLNDYRPWEMAFSDIQRTIHGKRCFITLEDDLDYFYVGTLTVNEWRSDPGWSRIVINYNLEPFKYSKKNKTFSLHIPAHGGNSVDLYPGDIGYAPVHPWVKIASSSYEDINIGLSYNNAELDHNTSLSISKPNLYVQIPDLILSNESGFNEVSILLEDARTGSETDTYEAEIVYNRGYL